MAYTAPTTRVTGELMTAAIVNTDYVDNLIALKDPPSANEDVDEVADYTTTSNSFVDVDATDLALAITTKGGDVLVHFHGTVSNNNTGSAGALFLDIDVDGARVGGDDGIIKVRVDNSNQEMPVSFSRLITGLAAASHTFKLQWKVMESGGTTTATMFAGAGTARGDIHPQFWPREVS